VLEGGQTGHKMCEKCVSARSILPKIICCSIFALGGGLGDVSLRKSHEVTSKKLALSCFERQLWDKMKL
jgi:hypothetical protein